MISAILYGRNDSHGYNLHKRAAISFNCIAEMLSDADDEILFVDYNTPNDLPTFIEAIYDTLTPKAKQLLRVFRVRPELHARIGGRTHLAALEPHARNIAIRRSNPANRWILLTNTDMVFIPRSGNWTISTAAEDLPDGQYIVPRFELPEPLWESFPRSDPQTVMRACEELGRNLHLDEITASHRYMRFDAPGDFQLAPRKALFEIRGFDERMIHGWHADSNMCKRLFLYYGNRTESLARRLKGYHCDHTRVATGTHRQDIKPENNLYEFVYLVKDPVAPEQESTWGAPDIDVEQVDFSNGPQARYVTAVQAVLGEPQTHEYYSDSNDGRNYVEYSGKHVLPYVTSNLTVYPRSARLVYLGNHPTMLRLLARSIVEMGFSSTLDYVPSLFTTKITCADANALTLENGAELLETLSDYDLIVFDLGLDRSSVDVPAQITRVTDWPREHRYSIGRVARLIRELAEHSDGRWQSGKRVPEFLLLNANHYLLSCFVSRFVLAVTTPYTSRTRKGRPRVGDERLYQSAAWHASLDHMRAFFGYDATAFPALPAEPGVVVDLTSAGHADAYKGGHWGAADEWGCWTDGTHADIILPVSSPPRDLLIFINVSAAFEGLSREPIRLVVFFEGEQLGSWRTLPGYALVRYRQVLPGSLMTGKHECCLRLEIENPQSVQEVIDATGQFRIGDDPQQLGVRVQSISFASIDVLRLKIGHTLDFTDKGNGAVHMNECWTQPDNLGAWTLGPESRLVFVVEDIPKEGAIARFTITDVAVNEVHPNLNVTVFVNTCEVARWCLGPHRVKEERSILVTSEILGSQSPMQISFKIDSPRSPDELDWTKGDTRPLGFRLTGFRLDRYGLPRLKIGETIDFTSGGRGAELLREQWGTPDQYGTWTMGKESRIHVCLDNAPSGIIPAAFVISDCMVSASTPELSVTVKANGQQVGDWTFGLNHRAPHVRMLEFPRTVVSPSGALMLTFEVADPRTPLSLGWSEDSRPLGIRIARALFGANDVAIPQFGAANPAGGIRHNMGRVFRALRAATGGGA